MAYKEGATASGAEVQSLVLRELTFNPNLVHGYRKRTELEPDLLHMGDFFTKAAFLTIGGAYAVLPYVYQGGVEHYGWLTGSQMMDGLALGETTPGPLIMIVTWVGYVGGVSKAVAANPVVAGLAGAAVATFFTFLPSFLFIVAGGPMVEATRGELKFTAPLTGITAAVVGVILNLAVGGDWPGNPDASTPFPAEMRVDCLETQAAIWLSLGRLWKYFITSKVLIFSTRPVTCTCLSRVCQGKSRLIRGFPSS